MQVFDHSAEGQLLYFKERFVGTNHPRRTEMETFSAKLRRLGLPDMMVFGPTKAEFAQVRERAGLDENLNRKRGVTVMVENGTSPKAQTLR